MLDTVCRFFYYKLKNRGEKNVPDMELPVEQLLQLIVAADFLDSTLDVVNGMDLC